MTNLGTWVSFTTNTYTYCLSLQLPPSMPLCPAVPPDAPGPETLWMDWTCPLSAWPAGPDPLCRVTGPDGVQLLEVTCLPLLPSHRNRDLLVPPNPPQSNTRMLSPQEVNRDMHPLPPPPVPGFARNSLPPGPPPSQSPGPLFKGQRHIHTHRHYLFPEEPDRGKTTIIPHFPKIKKPLTTNADGLEKPNVLCLRSNYLLLWK